MENNKSKNVTLLLTLSSMFEYYDFIIYGLMSSYLGQLFFPQENLFLGQLQAFSLFAIGYIIRPFGGIILALFGDSHNLKKVFVRSNFVLAIATLIISIMPSYSQIGAFSGIALIILRMAQAITFAVELPGAMHFVQYTSQNDSTKKFSFVISGSAVGAILASASLFILESKFTNEEIINYAWRIPFILGSILCLISIMLRKQLPEITQTPITKTELLKQILPEYKQIIASVLIIILPAFLIIMNIFFPSFLKEFYQYTTQEIYLSISISLLWSAIYAPIFSHLIARINKIALLKFSIIITILLGLVINFLFLRHSLQHLIIGLCIYQSIITSLILLIFPLMATMFEPHIRFTLMTACYNIGYALTALSPILVTKLCDKWHSPFGMWAILIVICAFILTNVSNFFDQQN